MLSSIRENFERCVPFSGREFIVFTARFIALLTRKSFSLLFSPVRGMVEWRGKKRGREGDGEKVRVKRKKGVLRKERCRNEVLAVFMHKCLHYWAYACRHTFFAFVSVFLHL